MKAVRRGIETNIKGNLLFIEELSQFFLIRALRNKTALLQCIKNIYQQTRSFDFTFLRQSLPLETPPPGEGAAGAGAAGSGVTGAEGASCWVFCGVSCGVGAGWGC